MKHRSSKAPKVEDRPQVVETITKLLLSDFQTALVDRDLSVLILKGNPDQEQLNEAWNKIKDEFNDASAGPQQKAYIQILKEIAQLQADYSIVITIINTLRICYVQRFAERLNKILRSSFKLDITNLKQYDADLDGATSRTKSYQLKLKIKESSLNALAKKFNAEELKEPTRADFQNVLITLSDHCGHQLKETEITVYEYCERLARYQKAIEAKAAAEKRK